MEDRSEDLLSKLYFTLSPIALNDRKGHSTRPQPIPTNLPLYSKPVSGKTPSSPRPSPSTLLFPPGL